MTQKTTYFSLSKAFLLFVLSSLLCLDSCTICGCHWRKHKHITYECDTGLFYARADTIISTVGNKRLCQDEFDKYSSDLREEKRIIQHVYIRLAQFLNANLILPINNDDYKDYLQYFIDEERMKQNAGAHNRQIIANLEKIMADYNDEIEIFKQSLKRQRDGGEQIEALQLEDVFIVINTLYHLRINGQQIREQVKAQETSEQRSGAQHEKYIELQQAAAATSKLTRQIMTLFPNNPSSDMLPIVFTVGGTISFPANTDPYLFQLVKCTTDEELDTNVSNAKCMFCVVSQKTVHEQLLLNTQLLKYYFLISPKSMAEINLEGVGKLTYGSSVAHLLNELWNDLSQYYNNLAHRAFIREKDHTKGKRLLAKSKKCQQMLLNETEKALKLYGDIHNIANLNAQTSINPKSE